MPQRIANSRQAPSQSEEQEALVARASRFDKLLAEPGWDEIAEFMAANVNDAIKAAADTEVLRYEDATLHVLRWNAKRQLLDSAIAYIDETRNLRDKIVEEVKAEQDSTGYPY